LSCGVDVLLYEQAERSEVFRKQNSNAAHSVAENGAVVFVAVAQRASKGAAALSALTHPYHNFEHVAQTDFAKHKMA
jgi:hypothetical protein